MMKGDYSKLGTLFFVVMLLNGLMATGRADATDVEKCIEKPVRKAIDLRQEMNSSASAWRTEKEKQEALYNDLLKARDRFLARKEQLSGNKARLLVQIGERRRQLADIEQISQQITPYLNDVLKRLKQLYQRDVPFLKEERGKRIDLLDSLLAASDITVSEKFRKVMEALLVEAEYGTTIEVYQETIALDRQPTLVNLFRLGRVSLFYATLDKQQCGIYNAAQKSWKRLPDLYLHDILIAMEIGAKRRPAELLQLPVGRMEVQ